MGASAILELAYRAGVVPDHLHGKTQQKTLQARLSEDILHHRDTSVFYRTEPGQFFLTEFLTDKSIPDEWKVRFPARRRTRDLSRANMLGVCRAFVASWGNQSADAETFFEAAEAAGAMAYMHPEDMKKEGYCSTWTFSMVEKDDCSLAYRIGRYRDDRDTYAKRRSIGFPGALTVEDSTLFSRDRLGAEDCAITVLSQDLDLTISSFNDPASEHPKIDSVMVIEDGEVIDVVVVLTWRCPNWFEPTTRRLSLNDPHWLCTSTRHNDLADFEPWSSAILEKRITTLERSEIGDEAHHRSTGSLSCVRTGQ